MAGRTTPPPPGPNDNLSLSENGQALLKNYEGKPGTDGEPALTFYDNDGAGNCTVGWGHLVGGGGDCSASIEGKPITRQKAEELFQQDVLSHENNVKKRVNIPLTQNQFDALVMLDFTFGIGNARQLLGIINTKNLNLNTVKSSLIREWSDILGAEGLKYRRYDEVELFLHGDYNRNYDNKTLTPENRKELILRQ